MTAPLRPDYFDYYPVNQDEEDYIAWIDAPGEDAHVVAEGTRAINKLIAAARDVQKAEPPLVMLLKGAKPYGHVAYSRQNKKTGKISRVRAKGSKPEKPRKLRSKPKAKKEGEKPEPTEITWLIKKNPFSKSDEPNIAWVLYKNLRAQHTTIGTNPKEWKKVIEATYREDGWEGDFEQMTHEALEHFANQGVIDMRMPTGGSVDYDIETLAGALERAEGVAPDVTIKNSFGFQFGLKPGRLLSIALRDQQIIREQFRALVKNHGLSSVKVDARMAHVYLIKRMRNYGGLHNTGTGRIIIETSRHTLTRAYLMRKAADAGAKASVREADALRTVIHETVHGCTPEFLRMSASYRTRKGKQLEEVTTEILARHIMVKETGRPESDLVDSVVNPTEQSSFGSYSRWVTDCVRTVAFALGVSMPEAVKKTIAGAMAVKTMPAVAPVVADAYGFRESQSGGGETTETRMATDAFIGAITSNPHQRALLKGELWQSRGEY